MEQNLPHEQAEWDGAGDDSEGETIILHASKNNTPMKPKEPLASSRAEDNVRQLRHLQDETSAQRDDSRPQPRHYEDSKKRKLRGSDSWRGRMRHSGGSESPRKKVRITSSDDEGSYYTSSETDDVKKPGLSWKLRLKRRASAGGDDTRWWTQPGCETQQADVAGRRQKPSDPSRPSAISHFPRRLSPHRSASHEIRPRSTSPYQLHHRRAASHQSAPLLKSEDSERRLRSSLRNSRQPDHHSSSHSMAPRKEIDEVGRVPLHKACEKGDEARVTEILQESPADIDKGDYNGTRPLHYAARKGRTGVIRLLLDAGCNIDARNDQSETALLNALEEEHPAAAEMLINAGANPWMKDGWFTMPKDLLDNFDEPDRARLARVLDDSALNRLKKARKLMKDAEELSGKPAAELKEQVQQLLSHSPPHVSRMDKKYMEDFKSIKDMEEACLLGEEGLIYSMRLAGTKFNFKCALAAAKSGIKTVLSQILDSGNNLKSGMDPQGELEELMLMAIGRGNLNLVQYLLDAGIDVERVGKRKYHAIATDRKGPWGYQEVEILRAAAGKARQRTGISENVGAMSMDARQAASPTLPAVEEEVKMEVEPPQQSREEYLASLPIGIAAVLREGGQLARKHELSPSECQWKRSIDGKLRCDKGFQTVKRKFVDPQCPAGAGEEMYTLSLYATFLFRHHDLEEARKIPGVRVIEMGRVLRMHFWQWIRAQCWEDADWFQAPIEAVEAHCKLKYKIQMRPDLTRGPDGKERHQVNYQNEGALSKQKFEAMDEKDFYFIDVSSFLAEFWRKPWLRDTGPEGKAPLRPTFAEGISHWFDNVQYPHDATSPQVLEGRFEKGLQMFQAWRNRKPEYSVGLNEVPPRGYSAETGMAGAEAGEAMDLGA